MEKEDDDRSPIESFAALLTMLQERTELAQAFLADSNQEWLARRTQLSSASESRLPSKHFLTTKMIAELVAEAPTCCITATSKESVEACSRAFEDEINKSSLFVQNLIRAQAGVKTSMDTHKKQLQQKRDKAKKTADRIAKASPSKPVSQSKSESKGDGSILALDFMRIEQILTVALDAEGLASAAHADMVVEHVDWHLPWQMVNCPEVQELIAQKNKQFNMNYLVFKAGYESIPKFKKVGATDAAVGNLDCVAGKIGSYFPPVDLHFPEERLPEQFKQHPSQWQQLVLHGASGAHASVGTEDSQLGTFRGILTGQKFIATLPFLDIVKFMAEKGYAQPPIHLRTVRMFLLEQITQDIFDSMATSVQVRYATVEAGNLLFIPMGTIVIEKSMGKNVSALEFVMFVKSHHSQRIRD